jgi:Flp pilus assembly pilin Flp
MMMQAYFRTFMQLLRDQDGAVLVEYSLVLTLIGMIAFVGFFIIASSVAGVYESDNVGYKHMYINYQRPLP